MGQKKKSALEQDPEYYLLLVPDVVVTDIVAAVAEIARDPLIELNILWKYNHYSLLIN